MTWLIAGAVIIALVVLLYRGLAGFRQSGWFYFARAALLFSITCLFTSLFVVALRLLAIVPVVVVVLLVIRARAKRKAGSAYGTARWADVTDMASAGMFQLGGIPVGLAPRVRLRDAFNYLRTAPTWAAETASRLALSVFRRPLLTVNTGVHAVCFAPAGVGKTTGIVIPFLLSCSESAVVIDIKGEIYKATAGRRRQMGQRVVVLDLYGVVTDKSDSLNPLAHIDPKHPHALDDIRALAEAIVVRTGNEKEPHFDDVAEMVIGAMIAFVVSALNEADLQSVADFVSSPIGFDKAVAAMMESEDFDGILRRMGGSIAQLADREKSSVLSTSNRHLRFNNTPAVRRVTSSSTFDPRDLSNTTVYLVIPPDKLASNVGLLRLWITTLIHGVVRSGPKQHGGVRFVIDEAAAVMGGKMEIIETAIAQLRGYGLKFLLMFQSQGQLQSVSREGQAQTLLALMDTRMYAGVNDFQTGEEVSNSLGDATIRTESQNGGTSWSTSTDPQGMASRSTSGSDGWSTQEVGRKLLQPAEVMSLPSQTAVVFAKGVPPFTATLARCFDPGFQKLIQPASAGKVIRNCFLLAAVILALAVALFAIPQARAPPAVPTTPGGEP